MAVPVANADPATEHCPSDGGVKIEASESPATVTVTDTTTGNPVDVVVTITDSTFEITPAEGDSTFAGATWCAKSATKASAGTGTTGSSPSTNKHGIPQDIGYVVLYGVSTEGPAESTCYHSDLASYDFELTGPIDAAHNGTVYASTRGQCLGEPYQTVTVVSAPAGQAEADAKCTALGQGTGIGPLTSEAFQYVNAPSDWWWCTEFIQH
jgi:hypothetical protein